MATLGLRSCVARQEPYIPGALSILQGTVPGQVRGSGHMVPTYFRRELRDRALQRPLRLRAFVSSLRLRLLSLVPLAPPSYSATGSRLLASPMTTSSGVSSTPRLRDSSTSASGYWIARLRG